MLALFIAFIGSMLFAKPQGLDLDLNIGSSLNIIDSNDVAQMGAAFGTDNVKFAVKFGVSKVYDEDLNPPAYAYMGTVKPYILLEYPYYIESKEFEQVFSMGPIFDVGSSINTVNGKLNISLFELGFGLKLEYFFSDSYGIGFTPCHFTISTVKWKRGIGSEWQLGMSYDTSFSLVFVW